MTDSIHGHAVMEMMLESRDPFTKASLKSAIEAKFGAQARFHTCSANNLTAEELIDFLAARGKFTEQEGKGFQTDASKICDH